MVFIEFFEEIMDYSPWFSSNFRRNQSMVFIEFFEEIMDYSPWFSSHFLKKSGSP